MSPVYIAAVISLSAISTTSDAIAITSWTPIDGGNALANEASIERQSNGNVRVWLKDLMLPNVRRTLQRDLLADGVKVDYSDYEYSISRWEYDCTRKRHATVSGADYSSTGEVINSFDIDKPEFQSVIPESWGEQRMNFICGHKRARKPR